MDRVSYEPEIGIVIESSPRNITVEVISYKKFKTYQKELQIGKYLKIEVDEDIFIIVNIQKVNTIFGKDEDGNEEVKFHINTNPIGSLNENGVFDRGNVSLPSPMEKVYLVGNETLETIFSASSQFNFPMGKLSQNTDIELRIDGNNFFSKHVAIVGSTGSGKSFTVAKILHQVLGIENGKNLNKENQNNTHVIIFDLHSEYPAAFDLGDDQYFGVNILDDTNLILPYWLMNADELETMFIESKDINVHNQKSQFRNAVILNKERHNPTVRDVTYDTPIYFDIREVQNYLENLNNEIMGKLEWESKPKLEDGALVLDRNKIYFDKIHAFVHTSDDPSNKAVEGPFYGEFDKFLMNLETKIKDKRLKFLFNPSDKAEPYTSKDFIKIMKQFMGYNNNSNITIVDLSGIPFEVLTITVSLISRLVFDFCFHVSKLKHYRELLNDIPVLIVCEEAHNYAPRSEEERYKASKKSLEKLIKEGRKYGLSLMIVSQRPSEVSETIFAQCNNFIALRLTNVNDQLYIKNLLSDVSSSIADFLPNLTPGEFMITGDAVILPCIAKISIPVPEPKSRGVKFYQEWQNGWKDVDFENVIKRWRKEEVDLEKDE